MPWLSLTAAAVGAYTAKQKADAAKAGGSSVMGAGMGVGMNTDGRTSEAVFDNSGWNVSFGSSKIDSTAVKTVDQAGPSTPNSLGLNDALASFGDMLPGDNKTMVYVAIGALVLIAWKRKKK